MMAFASGAWAWRLALLALPPLLVGTVRAQDEGTAVDDGIDWSQFESVEDDDDDESQGDPFGSGVVDLLSELHEDPTLGGKISLYYTAVYRGRFHEFGDFAFPFPDAVSPDDQIWAEQLRRRHRNWDDHDLDQYLSLSWDEILSPEEESWWQKVDLDLSLRYFKDLDGSPAGEASLGTFDALAGNDQLRLQSLNATAELFDRHLEVRAGRQQLRGAEWIRFDGAKVRFRGVSFLGREVELSVFGGSRVRFFRRASSQHVGVGGASLTIWPWDGALFRLSDVYFLDNSLEAELRQSFGLGQVALTYRQIDESPSSIRADLHLEWQRSQLSLDLGYRGRLGDAVDDFDFDFTRSRRRDPSGTRYLWFGGLAPYDEVSLEARKGIFERWGVLAGGTVHRLRDREARDEWSTDWQEAWLGVDVVHAPWKGFTGRATVRYLHTDQRRRVLRFDADSVITNGIPDFQAVDITGDGEPDFLGVDLLVEQDFSRVVAAGAVLVFRGYDYQSNYAFLENLTASSATGYLRWNPGPRTTWQISYSHDRDFDKIYPDLEALHTVRLQFTYRL